MSSKSRITQCFRCTTSSTIEIEKTQSNLDNQRRYHVENFEPDRYGYNEIIVDECQDLTQLEFEFLRKLAMKEFLDEDSLHMFPQLGGDPEEILPGR